MNGRGQHDDFDKVLSLMFSSGVRVRLDARENLRSGERIFDTYCLRVDHLHTHAWNLQDRKSVV